MAPSSCAPQQARCNRERKWHRSARIQEELDGALTLRLRVAETSELKRWVLQFGSEAEGVRKRRWQVTQSCSGGTQSRRLDTTQARGLVG
jgi:hypothetical protein